MEFAKRRVPQRNLEVVAIGHPGNRYNACIIQKLHPFDPTNECPVFAGTQAAALCVNEWNEGIKSHAFSDGELRRLSEAVEGGSVVGCRNLSVSRVAFDVRPAFAVPVIRMETSCGGCGEDGGEKYCGGKFSITIRQLRGLK